MCQRCAHLDGITRLIGPVEITGLRHHYDGGAKKKATQFLARLQ